MKGTTVVSGVRRLSIISEQELDNLGTDFGSQDSLGVSVWAGSSFSLCSDNRNMKSSSHDPYQPDSGDDCAALLLSCLYCRFHECLGLLPEMCERAVSRRFPSYTYAKASSGKEKAGGDCSSCNLELDCSCWSSCQDTAELLELAMEISEVCYR
ncbi:myoD family inhibitor domain-containing protein 2-like [Lampris incognitus]|uniref:myoD family inhibitor domain-containing protein 2-like n=1 Tax=Lampris incognitus TaxID=2546036 RepID=UPI0024B5E671|nr:myoD family inhibitor domain-containing protein 2-like [Lampris incognitus]